MKLAIAAEGGDKIQNLHYSSWNLSLFLVPPVHIGFSVSNQHVIFTIYCSVYYVSKDDKNDKKAEVWDP